MVLSQQKRTLLTVMPGLKSKLLGQIANISLGHYTVHYIQWATIPILNSRVYLFQWWEGGGGGIIEFYMTIRNIFKTNDEARFFHTTSSLQPKQRSTQDLFVSWVRNVVR